MSSSARFDAREKGLSDSYDNQPEPKRTSESGTVRSSNLRLSYEECVMAFLVLRGATTSGKRSWGRQVSGKSYIRGHLLCELIDLVPFVPGVYGEKAVEY